VEIVENASYETLTDYLKTASVGIHSMYNEHFGISIIEYMASGLITIAHDSGGPRSDIIKPGTTGFLASTKEEYASAIFKALEMNKGSQLKMRKEARDYVKVKFSESTFSDGFLASIKGMI
jgi:alpha-1,2-mannosyltransferase